MVEIFIERLKNEMEIKKVSMYKLAKDLEVNKQTIKFWLDGTNEPKISYLIKLANYFDVSTDYLLGLEDFGGAKFSTKNYIHNLNNNGKVEIK